MKLTLIFIFGIVTPCALGGGIFDSLFPSHIQQTDEKLAEKVVEETLGYDISPDISSNINISFTPTLNETIVFEPAVDLQPEIPSITAPLSTNIPSIPTHDIPQIPDILNTIYTHKTIMYISIIASVFVAIVFICVLYVLYKKINRNKRQYTLQKEVYPDLSTPLYSVR